MSIREEGITDAVLAEVKPIGEHRFCGKIQCERGFYYKVREDGFCEGCEKKLKIVEVEE